MNKKVSAIYERDMNAWHKERGKVFNELSDAQAMFCCCGKLATGFHESRCGKFNDKVDRETAKRLTSKNNEL